MMVNVVPAGASSMTSDIKVNTFVSPEKQRVVLNILGNVDTKDIQSGISPYTAYAIWCENVKEKNQFIDEIENALSASLLFLEFQNVNEKVSTFDFDWIEK